MIVETIKRFTVAGIFNFEMNFRFVTLIKEKQIQKKNRDLQMHSDQNQLVVNTMSSRKIIKSRNSSKHIMNRVQKLKDKRMIYPESTLSKIVFVSNIEGNGFRRQNIYSFDVPAHIDLQAMINRINTACFEQWRNSLVKIQSQPLHTYDRFQTILGVFIFIIIIVLIALISIDYIANTQLLAYGFIILVFVGCMCSIFLMREKRVDINRDLEMVKAIKKELIKFNFQQKKEFSQNPRFIWTCHKDCLWIACQLH